MEYFKNSIQVGTLLGIDFQLPLVIWADACFFCNKLKKSNCLWKHIFKYYRERKKERVKTRLKLKHFCIAKVQNFNKTKKNRKWWSLSKSCQNHVKTGKTKLNFYIICVANKWTTLQVKNLGLWWHWLKLSPFLMPFPSHRCCALYPRCFHRTCLLLFKNEENM